MWRERDGLLEGMGKLAVGRGMGVLCSHSVQRTFGMYLLSSVCILRNCSRSGSTSFCTKHLIQKPQQMGIHGSWFQDCI